MINESRLLAALKKNLALREKLYEEYQQLTDQSPRWPHPMFGVAVMQDLDGIIKWLRELIADAEAGTLPEPEPVRTILGQPPPEPQELTFEDIREVAKKAARDEVSETVQMMRNSLVFTANENAAKFDNERVLHERTKADFKSCREALDRAQNTIVSLRDQLAKVETNTIKEDKAEIIRLCEVVRDRERQMRERDEWLDISQKETEKWKEFCKFLRDGMGL